MALMLVKKVMECAKASRTCCQFLLERNDMATIQVLVVTYKSLTFL